METPPQLNGPLTGGQTLFIGRWRVDPAADEIRSALAARKAAVNPARVLYAPEYSLSAKELGVH